MKNKIIEILDKHLIIEYSERNDESYINGISESAEEISKLLETNKSPDFLFPNMEGFRIDIIEHSLLEKGIGKLLLHPDDIPHKNK